ncbi:MAG: beta-N-acetylhexosaminidase, partial [Chitinophagaceae bacterium]
MKKAGIFLFLCIYINGYTQSDLRDIAIIPQPVSLVKQSGSFILPEQLTIYTDKNTDVKKIGTQLVERIITVTGYKVVLKESSEASSNGISLTLSTGKSFPKEGYSLQVKTSNIVLEAAEPAGIFYGVQTLLQLLPKEIVSNSKIVKEKWAIPAVTITDYPRFGWRGLMLDVSRHFFTKDQVKQYVDDMVKYKYNVLHWHLTDDQGWRIEIKSLPKLTSVGAWRVDKTGTFGTFSKPAPNEPRTYGGFYTQDDIKEIVQYAKERFVSILPEIDVPGHSLAAIAAYPELTCTPGTYAVSSGEKFMVWPGGGQHFYGLLDNALCPANEKVYEFMDKVFTEVAQLFPFEYIHMGGDETARNFWEKSSAIKA